MNTLKELLFGGKETPMDVAEKSAMKKLIEMDLSKETEFHNDYSIELSPSGFPPIDNSFVIGLHKK